jgi:hypothetical protein
VSLSTFWLAGAFTLVGSGDLTLIQIKLLIAGWSNGAIGNRNESDRFQFEIDAPQNPYIKATRSIPKFYSVIDILGAAATAMFGLHLGRAGMNLARCEPPTVV